MISAWREREISAYKQIVVLGVTVLYGREGRLGSGIDLARKSTNITGIIAVWPLKPLQKRTVTKGPPYQAIDGSTETSTALFAFRESIHRTTHVDIYLPRLPIVQIAGQNPL